MTILATEGRSMQHPQSLHTTSSQEDRLQLLSFATREGIWEYDFETGQAFYNQGMEELFGYTAAEMADNNEWWRSNIHPQDKKRIISSMDDLLKGDKTVWWGKYQFLCRNGSYKLIVDRLFVVRNPDGQPLRLIGTMQDMSELATLQEELEHISRTHRRAMVKAIFLAEEKERHSISEELHENINQVLAAINMHISQVKQYTTEEGLHWIKDAQELLLDSISGIRSISKRLSPIILTSLGLPTAFDELLSTLQENMPVKYSIRVDDEVLSLIDTRMQTVFYRIAETQVMNILRHSSATSVAIVMTVENERVHMSITDNGDGVDLKNLEYGRGFSIIQERAEAFGGSFKLQSTPGKKGFTMEVII